ncbi:unnamed protein product [Rotaria sp. Silwood2]|nr:unnamed protein product [Rotaria sp. Silwood2]CAF4485484.1 unnamed protein product [Rotaria sp. Silwood2]
MTAKSNSSTVTPIGSTNSSILIYFHGSSPRMFKTLCYLDFSSSLGSNFQCSLYNILVIHRAFYSICLGKQECCVIFKPNYFTRMLTTEDRRLCNTHSTELLFIKIHKLLCNTCGGKPSCYISAPLLSKKSCNGSQSNYVYAEYQCVPTRPKCKHHICSFENVDGGAIISSLNYTSELKECAQCDLYDPSIEIDSTESGVIRLCSNSHARYLLETCSNSIEIRYNNLVISTATTKYKVKLCINSQTSNENGFIETFHYSNTYQNEKQQCGKIDQPALEYDMNTQELTLTLDISDALPFASIKTATTTPKLPTATSINETDKPSNGKSNPEDFIVDTIVSILFVGIIIGFVLYRCR